MISFESFVKPSVFESGGYTKNRTNWRPFDERHTDEFGGESGALPFPRKNFNLGLAEMQFPAVLRGLLCTLQCLHSRYLSCSQFLPTPSPLSLFLCKFGQIVRPIFQKVGCMYPQSLLWFCTWKPTSDRCKAGKYC